MSRKLTITIIILLMLAFVAGFFAGTRLKTGFKCGGFASKSGENTYQAGYEAARKRLSDSGFFPMMAGMEIKAISGEAKEIKNGRIILAIRPLEPLSDPDLDTRNIVIASETKIFLQTPKDQSEFQKEMDAFSKSMQDRMKNPSQEAKPIMPPDMFIKKEVAVTDIKAGQQITVTAAEDIKDAKEIQATEITIQGINPLPPTADMAPSLAPAAAPTTTPAQ